MRCRALRFTCGALAPWKSQTLVPRRAAFLHWSPFFPTVEVEKLTGKYVAPALGQVTVAELGVLT